ncbi:beta-1,3-glucan-binding protein-like [Onthophagus taurus]|uniref:beta-1,3-glucan-binding protein-like n=1 Tax=Onthophagus taurus TaxID=166361 RepID=UPI000C20F50F|nr:beta-1,3-glucan-binding protein-like [Onthophagus taurus]
MKTWQILVSFCCLTFVKCNGVYRIPTPTFEPYKPRGLKLSIPNESGITLVAFHININQDIESKEGEYTKYIVNPMNNRWVYTNEVLRLRLADKVYVRITVLKDGEQYAYVFAPFIVQELLPQTSISNPYSSTTTTTQRPQYVIPTVTSTFPPSLSGNCQRVLQNVTRITLDLEEKLAEAGENIDALKDLLPGPYFVTIAGTITQTYDDPYDVVNLALKNLLKVNRVSYKTCVRNRDYIVCELSSIDDKIELVKCSKKSTAQSSQIKIIY